MLHFVANEERLFFKFKDSEEKFEFTLALNTNGGQDFYSRLKVNKSLEISFGDQGKYIQTKSLSLKIDTSIGDSAQHEYKLGEIIANTDEFLLIKKDFKDKYYERVGNIKEPEKFYSAFESDILPPGYFILQFLLEEEEKKKRKKSKSRNWKSNDWKTVKIIKRFKALKRYRIEKR